MHPQPPPTKLIATQPALFTFPLQMLFIVLVFSLMTPFLQNQTKACCPPSFRSGGGVLAVWSTGTTGVSLTRIGLEAGGGPLALRIWLPCDLGLVI